ncbi:filamentous hemagglutinin N-terminal domain-containing protein [Simkania sp.]|uniref:two-partner secretion domain-containing protein n=1 Tax=Simkania sp. TaxID=34094 RepID=UPI003B519CA2
MRSILPLLLAVNCFIGLHAAPVVDRVAQGKATFQQVKHEFTIHASDNCVINYKSFDVHTSEAVRFQMADPSHRVLNRIHSAHPSQINGALSSNGTVYLVNPAGIVFGPNSVINVAQLYAAAAHLSDQDFLMKKDLFTKIQGAIENHGLIEADLVSLIGKTVKQEGVVNAKHVLYAVGDQLLLGKEGEHLFIRVSEESLEAEQCFLEAGTPEAFFLVHSGTTKAEKVELLGDEDSLIRVGGSIAAQQHDIGGEITIHGEVLDLKAATLDVSAPLGGGTILAGGDFHGENASASYLICDSSSTILSDATHSGDGGKVIIWSNKRTAFDGKVFARGGPQGGNGGFVETSSGDRFGSSSCLVNTSAPKGNYGTWELDPSTIQFTPNGANTPTLAQLADSNSDTGYFDVNPSVVNSAVSDVELNAVKPVGANPPSSTTIFVGNASDAVTIDITAPNVKLTLNTGQDPNPPNARGTFKPHGSIKTTGDLIINANTALFGDTTLTSVNGGVEFNGFVSSDLPNDPKKLTVDAAQAVTFNGNVGGNLLSDITIQNATQVSFLGDSTQLASKISAQGPITFGQVSPVTPQNLTLRGDSDISTTSGNITFNLAVNVDTPANFWNLGLETPGDITFVKNVGSNLGGSQLGDFTIRNANHVKFLPNPIVAQGFYAVNVQSFTLENGTGDIDFQGPLYTSGSAFNSNPSAPMNGGNVSIKTSGKINFYYLVNESGTATPYLQVPSGKKAFIKAVINTSGGRVLSSQPGNGYSGGNVSLEADSINLLALYAGGTTAFPGSTGIGGKGGDVSITTTNGTLLQGPIFATGGPGTGGGGQVLPALVFPNQNFSQAGQDSPGNVTITGPLTLGFNGIVLRGGDISVESVTGPVKNLLAFDAATHGLVAGTGTLANLSYLVVNNAKKATFDSTVNADGLVLFNSGDAGMLFKEQVTGTSALAIKNRFTVTFDQPLMVQNEQLLNCGQTPPPTPGNGGGQSSGTTQESFQGSFSPTSAATTTLSNQPVQHSSKISLRNEKEKSNTAFEEEISSFFSQHYQYRSFELTYLFKIKSENEISLEIFDLSQQCLFETVFSSKDLSLPDTHHLLENGHFSPVLERLAEKQLLAEEHFVHDAQESTKLTCEKEFDRIIEKRQNQDPIPNFSLFKKENPKLAKTNLQMARAYAEEKEFEEALESYAKALQYTRNASDYASLPSLYETMGEYEKANLANLFSAKYHFIADKPLEALQILETCSSSSLEITPLLIELYYYCKKPTRALALLKQTADTFSIENPEQAISLYKRILQNHPAEFSLYSSLATLIEQPQEKAQALFKGALFALQKGDHSIAESLIQKAESYSADSFANGLISLDLFKKQRHIPLVKHTLRDIATVLENQSDPNQLLAVYKMLFKFEGSSEYSQKIFSTYLVLQQPEKAFEWSLNSISLMIEHQQWEQAECLTKQTLEKTPTSLQKIVLYKKLEEIYTHWHEHELPELWPKLGKAYQETKQLALAEESYRKALKSSHRFEEAFELAEALKGSGKIQESVHIYYEAAIDALIEQNTSKLAQCTERIKQVDPQMQHLDRDQKMYLMMQEHLLKLSEELYQANKKIASFEQIVQFLEEKENSSRHTAEL